MLISIFFQIFMPFYINPADPNRTAAYTAGLQEVGNSYLTDKPATKYPMITLDVYAYDNQHNYIEPGIYAVDISLDDKKILIFRGRKIVAKCSVIQIIQLNKNQEAAVSTAEVAFIKNDKMFIVYKNKNLEFDGFLYKSDGLPN